MRSFNLRAVLFVGLFAGACCGALGVWVRQHEAEAVVAPERDTSFSWTVSHYLDEENATITYRFQIFPTAEGGFYRAEVSLDDHVQVHQGRLTAAQYDAFIYGLDECGLWEVESNHRYDSRLPTYVLRATEGEREHAAVFTGLSTAYQNSLQSFLARSLPGHEMESLVAAVQAERLPHLVPPPLAASAISRASTDRDAR